MYFRFFDFTCIIGVKTGIIQKVSALLYIFKMDMVFIF